MRSPFRSRSLCAVLFLWLSSISATWASHTLGADISYEYAGTTTSPNQYHVTVRLFRDISSLVADPNVVLTSGRNGCSAASAGSFTTTLARTSSVAVSTNCAGVGTNYELNSYDGMILLPPANWTLSVNVQNRATGVVNVLNSDSQSAFVKAELNNMGGVVNSSPRFLTNRLIQLTSFQAQQRYSVSAFDSEGDSLVYRLVQPLANPSAAAPCGVLTTGAIAPHFQLNAATGELVTVAGPTQLGRYALAARVDEYRRISGNWQLIGSITRDMTYFVTAGTNQPPTFTRVALTSSSTAQLLGQTLRVSAGQSLALTLTATDPDAGQVLTLSSELGAIVPGVTFQNLGNGQGQLTWQVPATRPPGRYTLTALAADNACPTPGVAVLTVPVLVTQQVLATRTRQALALAPFPVPFREAVHFQLTGQGSQPVTITDVLGRTVAQLKTAADGRITWQPASAVAAGLYFARNSDGTQVARLQYSGH